MKFNRYLQTAYVMFHTEVNLKFDCLMTLIHILLGKRQSKSMIPKDEVAVKGDDISNKPEEIVDTCPESFNAVTLTHNYKSMLFKGNSFYYLSPDLRLEGKPQNIVGKLRYETHVDAAYARPKDGKLVLFSGRR